MKKDRSREKLLLEAAEWRLLSLLFDCPNDEWLRQVKDISSEVRDKALRKAAAAAQTEADEGLYHFVFGPGGPAPGREVSYRSWVQPGYLLSEVSSYYEAFSYQPKTSEVPDHVAVETGFIAFLKLKEAFAWACSDIENAEITAKASKAFTAEHLSKYAEQMSKILKNSGIEYLTLAGNALFKRAGKDKERPKQIFLPVLEDEDELSEFECGIP
jgi:nitrate reductase assembly molybdenum cofactor insertion protein NarJ